MGAPMGLYRCNKTHALVLFDDVSKIEIAPGIDHEPHHMRDRAYVDYMPPFEANFEQIDAWSKVKLPNVLNTMYRAFLPIPDYSGPKIIYLKPGLDIHEWIKKHDNFGYRRSFLTPLWAFRNKPAIYANRSYLTNISPLIITDLELRDLELVNQLAKRALSEKFTRPIILQFKDDTYVNYIQFEGLTEIVDALPVLRKRKHSIMDFIRIYALLIQEATYLDAPIIQAEIRYQRQIKDIWDKETEKLLTTVLP